MSTKTKRAGGDDVATNVFGGLETGAYPTDQDLRRLGDEWWDIGPEVKKPTPEEISPPDACANAWW